MCGLLDFDAFDSSALSRAREIVECTADGEDCQAQTFFSFKYIIILWVSTCPCKGIDRADFFFFFFCQAMKTQHMNMYPSVPWK